MEKTLVSILIPTYNEELYIERCIESLLKQSFKDFEIIIIDAASKDNTVKLASKYMGIKIIVQKKRNGCGGARNLGAKYAKGKILLLVDADMYFHKDFIKTLIQPILKGKEIGTTHGTELIGNPENMRARTRSMNRISNPPKRMGNFRAILKDAYIKCGGQDEGYGFEDDMTQKVGTSLVMKNAICYHNNPSNLSEVYDHQKRQGKTLLATGMLKKYVQIYLKHIIILLFLIITLCLLDIFIFKIDWWKILLSIPIIFVLLIEIFALKRAIKEKYFMYILSLPILFTVRCYGIIVGMLEYLLFK